MFRQSADLDHDQFLLFRLLVRPVLSETEVDLEGWRVWSFSFLEQNQSWGQKLSLMYKLEVKFHYLADRVHLKLTLQEIVQAEDLNFFLPFKWVWWTLVGHAWSRPEHLTLTETNCVDILFPDLQDQTSVHHVQQGLGVELLLLVLNFRCPREPDLLQGNGSKQVHLIWGRLQMSIVKPTALWVTDCQRTHGPSPVLKFQVQICYYEEKGDHY